MAALTALRKAAGLSLRALAQRAGFDHTYLSRVETGRVEPGISRAYRIADALGASIEAAFPREEYVLRPGGDENRE